jgi:transcriptional regulator with XRE-family HTH domain
MLTEMSTIGNRLYCVRKKKTLSRAQLAVRATLQESDVADIENGRTIPDLGTLERLAAALPIPLVELFYDGERPPEFANLRGRLTADEIANAATQGLSKKNNTRPLPKSDNHSR